MTRDARLTRPLWRGRTNADALTIAALEDAERRAGHLFVVTKGSYQPVGDPDSADTHLRGGVIDIGECGHDACQEHLFRAGFAPFRRVPPLFTPHRHLIVVGHPDLDPSAAAQVAELRRGGDGLVGDGPFLGPRFPLVEPVWPPRTPPNTVQQARRVINRALKDLATVPASRDSVHRMRREVREALARGPKK